MKPLSELVKEWRIDGEKLSLSSDAALMNQANADELQAWLREADTDTPPKWFEKALLNLFRDNEYLFTKGRTLWQAIRRELLGTTRTEGSPEKLSLKGKK
jgi:hypothetical protein